MPVSQIELVSGILFLIDKMGVKGVSPRQINAVVKAADDIIDALQRPDVMATPNMGLDAWLRSDDTGISSLYMASVLAPVAGIGSPHFPNPRENHDPVPCDPSDFGRCVRLLEAVPKLRHYIYVLTGQKHSAAWNRIAAEWDLLEALYREELPSGKCPKLYARLTEPRSNLSCPNEPTSV